MHRFFLGDLVKKPHLLRSLHLIPNDRSIIFKCLNIFHLKNTILVNKASTLSLRRHHSSKKDFSKENFKSFSKKRGGKKKKKKYKNRFQISNRFVAHEWIIRFESETLFFLRGWSRSRWRKNHDSRQPPQTVWDSSLKFWRGKVGIKKMGGGWVLTFKLGRGGESKTK